MKIILADGKARALSTMVYTIDVILNNSPIRITFIPVPQFTESKTLLGEDYMCKANIILTMAKRELCFPTKYWKCIL